MYKLLLVDDEKLEREALTLFAKKSPFCSEFISQIEECASGSELVKKVPEFEPDIIILDINMPGLNGLEALKKIRDLECEAVVIISSAYNLFDYAVMAMQLGVVNFLVKPVKEKVFIEALKQGINILEKSRQSLGTGASDGSVSGKKNSDAVADEISDEASLEKQNLPESIRKVCDYIEENYNKQIQLDDIAEHCGYSRYHLSHLFSDAAGFTVFSYLLEVRMKKAKELLRGSNLSIKEISGVIGFSDQNYFSNVFKKQTGLSPMDFRKNL